LSETISIADPPEQRKLSPSGERMKLFRERQKDGLRCVTLEIRNEEIDVLIERGLLNDVARNDKEAIKAALYKHLDATLG
jgi:hypothetical protein